LQAAPLSRRNEMPPVSVYTQSAKRAAVLLLCYPKGEEMYLSLIKRAAYQGVHSGQISFPGGKPEPMDASLEDTALRECREELGVSLQAVSELIPLTPLYIPPSNFLVSPFVTYDPQYPDFFPDAREVASHIELPLFKLMELEIEQRKLTEGPLQGSPVPCYFYEGHTIWGATAMILTEFKVFLATLSRN